MFHVVTGARGVRRGAVTAMLLAAAIATFPAIAPATEPTARRVKIADLDLASPLGRQTLDRRVRLAIEQVCLPRGAASNRPSVKRVNACRQAARENVQRQLAEHGLPPLLAAGP